jgi:uncharacterized protein (TIGR02996 family)
VTTWFGRGQLAARTVSRRFADVAAAKRAYRALVALKRSQGFVLAQRRSPLSLALANPRAASNADIEAAILEDVDDARGYLVYADWLQGQGDPRGELITLQHALSSGGASDALRALEEALVTEHREILLGPLAARAFDVTWRLGFVRHARIHRSSELPLDELLRRVLAHPSCRFLEDLWLGASHWGDDHPGFGPTLLALAEADPPVLRTLRLGEPHLVLGDVSNLFRILPRLRTLSLSGTGLRLATSAPITIERLILSNTELGPSVAEQIAAVRWPRLDTLVFRRSFSFGPYVDELLDRLHPHAVPALRHVFLAASHLKYGEGAVDALVRSRIAPALERLDLDLPIDERDVEKLCAAAPRLERLRSIRLRDGNRVDAPMREELAARFADVRWSRFESDVPDAPPR